MNIMFNHFYLVHNLKVKINNIININYNHISIKYIKLI